MQERLAGNRGALFVLSDHICIAQLSTAMAA
jgi:hypothetical protein